MYRRYTSFALESIEQTFNGTVDFGKKISCTISRNGDLVSTMFLEVTLKKSSGASYFPAENFVKEVELEIGGQRIDKHYADWFRIYDELFRNGDEKLAYRRLVDFDRPTAGQDTGVIKRFYVPLIFFFNKTPGLALPLIALILQRAKAPCRFHRGPGIGKTTWTSSISTSGASLHDHMEATLSKCGEPVKPVEYQRFRESGTWLRAMT